MPRSYDTQEGALYGLFLNYFEADELRNFCRNECPDVVPALRVSVSADTLASEAVELLRSRGHITERLFRRIVEYRPASLAAASACALKWDLPAPRPAADAPPGRVGALQQGLTLAGYRLVRALGSGNYGSVWHALMPDGGPVALKILRPDLAHDPAHRDRFFRGAERMQLVEHPRVVRVRELHRGESGYFFYVMQHIEGDNLGRLCKLGRVPQTSVLAIVAQIADALAACHARNLIHRDVKPDNIVLDRNGAPYLTDFDLVSDADAVVLSQSRPAGSFGFLAPEVLAGQLPGVPGDIYGLGATAVYALGGRDLLTPGDLSRPIDALDCSADVKAVLRRATAPDPRHRHANMRALATDLQRVREPDPTPVSPPNGVLVERCDDGLVAHFDGRRVVFRDLGELIDMLAAARRQGVVRVQSRGLTPAERELLQTRLKPDHAIQHPPPQEPGSPEPSPPARQWFESLANLAMSAAWLGWVLTIKADTFKLASVIIPLYLSAPCLRVLHDREQRLAVRWLHWLVIIAIGALFVKVLLPLLAGYSTQIRSGGPSFFSLLLLALAHPAAVIASVVYLARAPSQPED